jgi:cyclopropane fatty-acyl-phospholipid synthase-like methyltransferase
MNAVQELYTRRVDTYRSFVSFFHHADGLQRFFVNSGLLRPGLRVLDAGCGFGTASFALLEALTKQGFSDATIDAFDLTPAMLGRFQANLQERGIKNVRLKEADVIRLDQQLPSSWNDYDLIISASMLEYVSKPDLPLALSLLRRRMAGGGVLVSVITGKNVITKFLIEWWWKAQRYSSQELRESFIKAGFTNIRLAWFPLRYFWLNVANHIVVARSG